nr:serine/threonine-protein kinase MPS1-like [Lepeophtheirus salmonis]
MNNYLQFIIRAKKLRRIFEDPIRKKLDMHQKYLEENGFVTGSKSYNVGKELGRGGFSSIFSLDEQTFPHRSYALKITMAENERHDLLLQKEIDFLRDLSDSKRIIKMIANDIQDGFIFIVLELAEINLIQYLEKNHTNWIDLQEIHDKGIIHMDLKLENFVIVNHVLKIIDFGAAFQLPKGKIEMDVDEIFGTEGLCAPECFHNRVVETNDGNIHTISSISLNNKLYTRPKARFSFHHLVPWQILESLLDLSNKFVFAVAMWLGWFSFDRALNRKIQWIQIRRVWRPTIR